jgi:hypothetical protein
MDATLAEILASAWALLVRAAADPRHPGRIVQLATAGRDGAPRLRSVVLRGVDPVARVLCLHTDRARMQLRLAGAAAVLTDGPVWRTAWEATPIGSRADYAQADPPGTLAAVPPGEPTHPQPMQNFAVILLTIDRLDWLRLAPGANRRAGFAWDSGAVQGSWLVP